MFVTLMVLCMAGVMSLVMTIANTGVGPGLLGRWGRSFAIAFLVGWPTASVVVPMVRRIVAKVTG